MKRSVGGGLAHELEGLIAEDYGGFQSRKLYVLQGQPGLYRRLSKKDSKLEASVPAIFEGQLIYLVRQETLERELAEAGYASMHQSLDRLDRQANGHAQPPSIQPDLFTPATDGGLSEGPSEVEVAIGPAGDDGI